MYEGIKELDYPFIADIVGNTICADFLDYIKRDCFYTGLKMVYDPRIFSYFILAIPSKDNPKKKFRVCIHLERRRNNVRWDILNHCVELLRMRYDLAQKVYHHRVKRNFSAIIIKMVYCAIQCGIITKDHLLKNGDDVILYIILNSPEPKDKKKGDYFKASQKLAKAFRNRHIYEIVDDYPYKGDPETEEKDNIYNNPEERYNLERFLENLYQLDPGSVIVYSSKLNARKKALVKMCRLKKNDNLLIRTLKDLGELDEFKTIKKQLKVLKELYREMWKFFIVIDRKSIEEKMLDKAQIRRISKMISKKEKFPTEDIAKIIMAQEDLESKFLIANMKSICHQIENEISEIKHYTTTQDPLNIDIIDHIRKKIKDMVNK